MNKLIVIWIKVILIALLVIVSSFANSAETSNLEHQIAEKVKELNIPGAQVVTFDKQGITYSQSFGIQATDKPMTNGTLLRGGSTTKTLIALAIVNLAEQGAFSLDDSVMSLEPKLDINNPWQATNPVTVRHLIEHTSGLDDMHFKNMYNLDEPNISMLDAVNRDTGSLDVKWQPGTRHAYSNPGYGILGHLIEKFSGVSFEQYVREEIMLPIGMSSSYLSPNQVEKEVISEGYVNGQSIPFSRIYLRAAGSLLTSAEGLAKLGMFLLNKTQIDTLPNLTADVLESMEQPKTSIAAESGLEYGYGLGIYQTTKSNHVWFGHSGGIDGFLTNYYYSKDLEVGFVVMINTSSSSTRAIAEIVTDHLTQDVELDIPSAVSGVERKMDGYYRIVNERNKIFEGLAFLFGVATVETADDKLVLSPIIGEGMDYVHLGNQMFREPEQTHARMILLSNEQIGDAIQVDGQLFTRVNIISAWWPIVLMALFALSMLVALVHSLGWIVNAFRKKLTLQQVLLRLFPWLSYLSVITILLSVTALSISTLGVVTPQAVTFFVGTLAMAIFSMAGLVNFYRTNDVEGTKMRKLIGFYSVMPVLMSLYLWYFNIIGLMFWRW